MTSSCSLEHTRLEIPAPSATKFTSGYSIVVFLSKTIKPAVRAVLGLIVLSYDLLELAASSPDDASFTLSKNVLSALYISI